MSRQGAANSGWPAQRHPAGEPDPRNGGRPAQRPQTHQQQQPPQYAVPGQPAPGYPHQQAYPDQQGAAPGYGNPQQGYHYPQGQQAQPQPQPPQYAPPVQQPSAPAQHAQYGRPSPAAPKAPQQTPAAPQQQRPAVNRQGLSSLDSARNAQPTHDFENFPRTQPPQYAAPQATPRTAPPARQQPAQPAAPQRQAYGTPAADNPIFPEAGYRQPQQPAPQQPAPRQSAPQQPGPQHLGPQFDSRETHAPSYDQWPPAQPIHDHYGQDLDSGYGANEPAFSSGNQGYADPLEQADWAMPAAGYGDPSLEEQGYGHYDQQHAGALEPTYNQDEAGAYEMEEPRRVSWTMRVAGAVVLTVVLLYGLAQAYQAVLGSPVDTAPPVIASDSSPAKERPVDPGGRQFSHTDSKVLGRLGENDSAGHHADSGLYESDSSSDNGTKKVTTLVVGRDGSIAPPNAEPVSSASEPTVSVPGLMVVDAFGSGAGGPPPQRRMPDPEPMVVNTPTRPTVNVKSTRVIPATTASIDQEAPPAPRKQQQQQRVAAAPPVGDEGATSASGANGYVVVLGSVPASGTSRLDALRKFADMQQQYGGVLANKTPDVRETVLAGKGPYHRLLVGPPGSRSQANELCIQLKASGYKDCWVTAY